MVAFTPDKETWMKAKSYKLIGTSYIIGRVYRHVKKGRSARLFQIHWLDSQFQNTVETVGVGIVQRGVKNYVALTRVRNPNWRVLVEPDPTDVIDIGADNSDLEEEEIGAFDPGSVLPSSLAEVEAIRNMRFVPREDVQAPSYLYVHADGTTKTYARPEFKHMFEHSASSSFFAYIPIYFWRQVVHETNRYATVNDIRIINPFTLDEMMVFLGILFYMTTNDKGEYANYWGHKRKT
ncbi:hypothetical protein AM588_10002394 [Phytophthora nicotianae]|uniref:PiggyBac transposable element-derived protein domain-containing protein n=1 Tax=Phytophthora nicotianae TaxID=4792 RepID=A0A0W8CPW8_PHYNI|nr:hypothetical protein AM588_10002394 [Phytophthora nicotianae]